MTDKLRPYEESQEATPVEWIESGIACTEKDCPGEMMIRSPVTKHPQLRSLVRAYCGICQWRGWVSET
jgi:hypothetical protein